MSVLNKKKNKKHTRHQIYLGELPLSPVTLPSAVLLSSDTRFRNFDQISSASCENHGRSCADAGWFLRRQPVFDKAKPIQQLPFTVVDLVESHHNHKDSVGSIEKKLVSCVVLHMVYFRVIAYAEQQYESANSLNSNRLKFTRRVIINNAILSTSFNVNSKQQSHQQPPP